MQDRCACGMILDGGHGYQLHGSAHNSLLVQQAVGSDVVGTMPCICAVIPGLTQHVSHAPAMDTRPT